MPIPLEALIVAALFAIDISTSIISGRMIFHMRIVASTESPEDHPFRGMDYGPEDVRNIYQRKRCRTILQ
jgi:hypothetical protein